MCLMLSVILIMSVLTIWILTDDFVAGSLSPKGLQKLWNICEVFAIENDMIFNLKKTVCMFIKTKASVHIRIPDVFLHGNVLMWIPEHKYLCVSISNDFKDDLDIKQQIKSVC